MQSFIFREQSLKSRKTLIEFQKFILIEITFIEILFSYIVSVRAPTAKVSLQDSSKGNFTFFKPQKEGGGVSIQWINRLYTFQLPPAKLMAKVAGVDSDTIDQRRKALTRWLSIVTSHPAFSMDLMIKFFLTDISNDFANYLKDQFRYCTNNTDRASGVLTIFLEL